MSSNNVSVSVGILSYMRTDLLLDTIKCLELSHGRVELIVLNNNEDFCIKNEIEQVLPKRVTLKYIWDKKNHGVSCGRRVLFENCNNDIMILFDDDVYIDNFQKIYDDVVFSFSEDKSLGAIAFNIKEFKSLKHNRYEIPHKNKNVNMEENFKTYLIIGAGNALRVNAVKDAGNFADDFGLYGFEEIDLAFRILNSGYNIYYHCENVVLHKKSPDGRFSGDLVNYLYFVNRTKIAKRHFKLHYFLACLFVRGGFFIFKTKNFKLLIQALMEIFGDKKKKMFNKRFYQYIKSVNGFIWY
ncbi:glycosyltransferase family 2 protein [Vibrio parahaemolyticus]|nr:glycosyltransferase [Vibrio parahaemolyticus]